MRLGEVEVPSPGPGEILIHVKAAGVNRADVEQRQGHYPPPAGASPILGVEVAGVVAELGSGVTAFRVGDPVMALLSGGGYAEFAVAAEGECLPLPEGLSAVEAAALPEAYFTIWSNLFDLGKLKAGERVLIHGGTSGVGSAAISLLSAFGATVYATARSGEKCRACVELGAHRAINYREEDFVAAVMKETSGEGVDLILDMVGGEYFPRNLSILRRGGRLVHIDCQAGDLAQIDLGTLITKNLVVAGSVLRRRPRAEKAAIAKAVAERLIPLVASGRVRPLIAEVFPLERAAEAHALMESSAHMGKIVLEP